MIAADEFCELLRLRIAMAQHLFPDLPLRGPQYRCDPLFEAGADLSDALSIYEKGTAGISVVREGALRVASLAFVVYWSTVAGGPPAREEWDGC